MSLIRGKLGNRRGFSEWKNHVKRLSSSINQDNHPNVVKSDSKDIVIPDITLPELIYSKIGGYSNLIATESAKSGKTYTFDQIAIKSRNLSKHLRQKFKLEDGDVIAFLLPNLPEFVICFLGALEARLTVTTMNHMYTADEISKQIYDASPKIIITQGPQLDTLRTALNMLKRDVPTIFVKERQDESIPQGTIDFFELINTPIDVPDLQPGKSMDVAIMPYSSGTTGLPKGVQLCHKNLVTNIIQFCSEDFRHYDQPSENFQEISPAVLPFYHIYGMMMNFLFLYNGVRCIAIEKFTPEFYLSVLEKYYPTVISAAPPLVHFLSAHPAVKKEYFKNLKMLSSGAAPLGFMDEERFLKKAGRSDIRMVQGYGLTETSPAISHSPINVERTEKNGGSVGKLLPNTSMKIINPDDPTGTPLGPNQKGELVVKGPQVMKGYYNKPEETTNAFLDGWLRTGDIGYYNEDKHIWISDRLKELIKVKGFQVPPAELEELIRNHPTVDDAAVIGIPHPLHGEVPRAYIVPKKDKNFNSDELNEYVAEKVASYKKLAGGIEVVDSIPKNAAGKILRRKLKEGYLLKNA